jgi:hypothetical protein
MPKKAVSVERQLLLDAFKASQKEKKQEREGWLDSNFLMVKMATKPKKAQLEGVARLVNEKAGGDSRPGGPLVTFH